MNEISRLLARLDDASAYPFVGPGLPPAGHPEALDFFFATTLQQFGFWSEKDGRYDRPMVAPLGGVELKGSSYLFTAFLRRLEKDQGFCSPARQADMTREELLDVFRADDGSDPMPALELHLAQARQYGRDMLALGLTPAALIENARASSRPLQHLLCSLDRVGGYKEDPLRKKSSLLALILSQRPEGFLAFGKQRGCRARDRLPPDALVPQDRPGRCRRRRAARQSLVARQVIDAGEEWAVRVAAYRAIEQVISASGKSCGAVDWFFFSARRRCPEMSRPECAQCPIDSACAHRIELYQPVHRTVFY